LWELAVVEVDVPQEGLLQVLAAVEEVALQDILDPAVDALDHAVGLRPPYSPAWTFAGPGFTESGVVKARLSPRFLKSPRLWRTENCANETRAVTQLRLARAHSLRRNKPALVDRDIRTG